MSHNLRYLIHTALLFGSLVPLGLGIWLLLNGDRTLIGIFLCFGAGFNLLAAVLMQVRLIRSLDALRRLALDVAAGKFGAQNPIRTGDEFGELGSVMAQMAREIEEQHGKVSVTAGWSLTSRGGGAESASEHGERRASADWLSP